MEQRQLHITKLAIAAFNAVDVDAFVGFASEDFEWSPSMSPIEGERFHGADGIRRYFELLGDAWERFEIEPERYLETDAGVLMLGRLHGQGRGSGAAAESSLGMAFDFHGEEIARIRGFLDHETACAATGLEP